MADAQPQDNPTPPSAETMAADALAGAEKAAQTLASEAGTDPQAMQMPSFDPADRTDGAPTALSMLNDVQLQVKVELGRTRMYVEDVLRLNADSVVELDKAAGDPVDIYVNDRHVARGEVLVVNENFCVRVSEIIRPISPEG